MGWRTVDILTLAYGTAPSGRLHRALVQKGLASSIWGYERMMRDPGYANFGAQLTKDAALEPARDALLAALEDPARERITDAEVERARTTLLNDMDKAPLDSQGYVRWLGEFASMGDWRLFFLYRERVRKVSTADVQRAADTYLKPANRVLGAFVPTDKPERAEIGAAPDLTQALIQLTRRQSMLAEPHPHDRERREIRVRTRDLDREPE